MKTKVKQFNQTINKQNMFHDNQPSTDIQDSCSKSYSSRYLIKKKKVNFSEVLPSRYEKAAIIIQKYWRFRQFMKRKYYTQILQHCSLQNQCYELQNNILNKAINQYQRLIEYKKKLKEIQIKDKFKSNENQITQIIKKCITATFKMQKRKPSSQIFQALMDEKQLLRERNLELNRQKMLFKYKIHQQMKKQEEIYLRQIKEISIQHLQIVKKRNQIQKQYKEGLLQTSKFGKIDDRNVQGDLDFKLEEEIKLRKNMHKIKPNDEIFNDFDQNF